MVWQSFSILCNSISNMKRSCDYLDLPLQYSPNKKRKIDASILTVKAIGGTLNSDFAIFDKMF